MHVASELTLSLALEVNCLGHMKRFTATARPKWCAVESAATMRQCRPLERLTNTVPDLIATWSIDNRLSITVNVVKSRRDLDFCMLKHAIERAEGNFGPPRHKSATTPAV